MAPGRRPGSFAAGRTVLLALVALGGCDADVPGHRAPVHLAAAPSPADSIDARLHDFRAGMPAVAALPPDAPASLEELGRRFLDALQTHDTAALRMLHVSAPEYAYLYYPFSIYAREPYRQDPGVRWFLMVQSSEKGIGRALQRLGGRDLRYGGVSCPAAPARQGANGIWRDCTVRIDRGRGPAEVRLFGAVLERNGRFRFLSYANGL